MVFSKNFKKNIFFTAARATRLFQGVKWHTSTPLEAMEVAEIFPRAEIYVAKNIPAQAEKRHFERTFEAIKLLYVGRISRKKNLDFVIDVLTALNFNTRVHLRIVGPKEDRDYAGNIMKAAQVDSQLEVTMEGSLNHEKVRGDWSPSRSKSRTSIANSSTIPPLAYVTKF